ncbi:MAG TPA: acetate kinase [Candidatus Avichristensenella intestinipullorum]|uniref:Acetate kinase n=1 Tax=Candidatus Avichristensenella intestinipullorum TaxID=2840693 RepID=A0A9D0YXL1_9FIRM|nr:acetate kinase [Candidatus Avichristensenella intestinipullorum]
MNILIINAGSSSLKYQLIDMSTETLLAKGLCERIGIEGSNITQKVGEKKYERTLPLPDHAAAFEAVVAALTDAENGVIADMSSIGAVGHRVLHGGADFTASALIDGPVLKAIEDNIPLGPLHNPANLTGILACRKIMPDVPMVAVFDTAFHQTMPRRAYLYGIPYRYYTEWKLRRYGFHGTSHRFVSAEAIRLLGNPAHSKVVICHLGNGSSMSAVVDGRCVDTSMGLTPLEGMLMGTRSGDLDPAVVGVIGEREGMAAQDVVTMLNKKSGFMGLSDGLSSDWRDIYAAYAQGDDRGVRTAEVFAYRIRKYIGSYAAAMNGLDAVVFTAGIGENSADARRLILEDTEFLGIRLDEEKNRRNELYIQAADSRVKVMVVPTNEELAIARDTLEIVSGQ